jgi:hypothetical protein
MSVPDYTISSVEWAAYAEFGRRTIVDYFKPFPNILWYYTSASTFATILKTKKIWSTQIACLNDTTEYRRSVRLLRDSFKQYVHGQYDENTKWFANHLHTDGLQDDGDSSWFFVMCMSNRKDDRASGEHTEAARVASRLVCRLIT